MNSQDIEIQRSSSDFWFACVDIDVVRDSSLSLTVRGIYSIICSYASITNRSCWPTLETLAKDAGTSKSTVQRALKELIDKGIIVRQDRFDEKRQISSKILIVGFHASCYNEPETVSDHFVDTTEMVNGVAPMPTVGSTDDQRGCSPMTNRTIPKNDIITLTISPKKQMSLNPKQPPKKHQALITKKIKKTLTRPKIQILKKNLRLITRPKS